MPKFRNRDEILEDVEGQGLKTAVESEHLKALMEVNPHTAIQKLARELGITFGRIAKHQREIGKSKENNK